GLHRGGPGRACRALRGRGRVRLAAEEQARQYRKHTRQLQSRAHHDSSPCRILASHRLSQGFCLSDVSSVTALSVRNGRPELTRKIRKCGRCRAPTLGAAGVECVTRQPMLTLETDRLRLRMLREADLDAYAEMCADPEVMRYIGDGQPLARP